MKIYNLIKHNNKSHVNMLSIRGMLAIAVFCMVLGVGTISNAYTETPGTVLVETAKIRPTADTTGAPLASVKKNDTVSICDEVTGADGKIWYQVYVNATVKGFIRSDLVKKAGDATITTNTEQTVTTTTTTDLPETVATPVDRRTVYVKNNNSRIRKGASTQYGQVATANRGMVLTVTGEATGTDGKKWYQVAFNYNNAEITGYIRSDLVSSEALAQESVTSQITGTENEVVQEPVEQPIEEVPQEETIVQEEEPAASDTPAQQTTNESQGIVLMNVPEEPYVLPAFEKMIIKWEGQEINAYKNGDFYLFYARKANGEEGWFIFDSPKGTYQRYVYTSENATLPKESSNSAIPWVIAVIAVLALAGIVVYLVISKSGESSDNDESGEGRKFRFNFSFGSEDDEDDEDDEEDDENEEDEEEEDEDEEDEEEPVERRPQRPMNRRPQQERPNREAGERPVRPQGQRPQGQRPQGQGQRPVQGQPKRRPNPNQPRPSRPRPQEEYETGARPVKKAPLQNGFKAKNFLEADDDDMKFIDI